MSKIVFNELDNTPTAQPTGATMLYSKADGYLYARNGATAERPLDKPIDVVKQGTVLVDVVDDPYWDNVKVLLHCDAFSHENARLRDIAPTTRSGDYGPFDTWNIYGSTIDTSVKKYGTASVKFDGTDDYLYMPVQREDDDFVENDFTIEAWVYVTGNGSGSYKNILRTYRNVSSVDRGFYLYVGNGTGGDALKPGMFCSFTGGDGHVESPDSISLNTWTHIATVRDGGTIRLYVDGVQKASSICSGAYRYDDSSDYYIGTAGNAAHGTNTPISQYFQGNLDDIRVTNGTCRYPSGTTFTPPTKALPYVTKKLTTIVTDTSGYNASQPGWSTSDGDNTTVYTTSLGAKVGIGVTDPSNSRLHIATGHLNLDDDYAIAWGGGVSRASITGSKADSTLNINPGAGGVVVIGDAASTNATLSSAQVAKAWVQFSGTDTSNIRQSYNVSSVSDEGTGKYYVNFTTAIDDGSAQNDNYCVVATAGDNTPFTNQDFYVTAGSDSTSRCYVTCWSIYHFHHVDNSANTDPDKVSVVAFGR